MCVRTSSWIADRGRRHPIKARSPKSAQKKSYHRLITKRPVFKCLCAENMRFIFAVNRVEAKMGTSGNKVLFVIKIIS